MNKNRLVTAKQAELLRDLGFGERIACAIIKTSSGNLFTDTSTANWNKMPLFLSMPTVDEAIDWLRRKYNIIIYNSSAPFVDPRTNKSILYGYGVKVCSFNGWNFRRKIGETKWSSDSYAAKRQAIYIAIRWIKARQKQKKKKAKTIKFNLTSK